MINNLTERKLLEINSLTKNYVRNAASFPAVHNVNLFVERGEFISIIGRSGSGKTTLLNMAAGLLKPTSGTINVEGVDIAFFNDHEASHFRNTKIGYIPQGRSLLSHLTVRENIMLPGYLRTQKNTDKKIEETERIAAKALSLMEETGIAHLAASYPKELSGGEIKRVTIARALVNSPLLLIADEPTGDLDTAASADIMRLFKRIAETGTAVIMVTHELDTVQYSAKAYIMDAGNLRLRD
ncbi:MAG: ABC transporter ATP-binding protein [Treponema sp.]|jgi:putative ABC transport system ATP-binding protein|nr:ABC transporter ATP-binding protein [Treponema sp.]